MNAKMPELKRCFEGAGFTNVRTLLSSGNVVFDADSRSTAAIERKAEAAMTRALKASFLTRVRPVLELQALLSADPFARFDLPPDAKRVVSFLRSPPKGKLKLPIEQEGARILELRGCDILAAYVPNPRGPVFMTLLEKTFGREITTRTWDTVRKCAGA